MNLFHKLIQAINKKTMMSGVGVLALVLFSSFVLYEATKVEVVIAGSDEEQIVQTHKKTVEELFSEMGMTIGNYDFLSHEHDAPIEDGMTIDYKMAKQVTLNVDGQEQVFYTTEDTIQDFFGEHHLAFSEHDALSHNETDTIRNGETVYVLQGFEVVIEDGGETIVANSHGGTVENVLHANEIELNEADKVSPNLTEDVTADTKIKIVRVTTETEAKTEKVAHKTKTEKDSSLLKGKEKVLEQGQDGEVKKKYEITYENGKEVNRELIAETITKESVDRVVAVGTKAPAKKKASTQSSGSAPSGGKTITMKASAFTASCSGCSGVTATGINLKANPNRKVIAVDPNVIPLGSKVWVEGYGEAIAGDTGGAIKGNRIDVHVPNKSAAYSWGVRTVKVKVLN